MKSFGSFCSGKWGVSWAAAEGSGVYGNGQWLEEEQVM